MGETKPSAIVPAPLGMAAFGISTILLCFWNVGWYDLGSVNLAMALFFGSLCQFIVGIFCFQQDLLLEMMIYVSFGAFWIILIIIEMFPLVGGGGASAWAFMPPLACKGWYCMVWMHLTGVFASSAACISWLSLISLGLMTVLWAGIGIFNFTENLFWLKLAGWAGIIAGTIGVYIAIGIHLNVSYEKNLVPLLGTGIGRAAAKPEPAIDQDPESPSEKSLGSESEELGTEEQS